MLHSALLKSELDARRDEFAEFQLEAGKQATGYAARLDALHELTSAEIFTRLSGSSAGSSPGAMPSAELDRKGHVTLRFEHQWKSHEQARRWAVGVLSDRVTFAADGSQLLPGRDISLPVAAVQVAWFENPHCPDARYVKNARLEVLPPAKLYDNDGHINAEKLVTFHRTRLEIEQICDFMRRKSGWRERGERMPVAFFDGSLAYLISFQMPKSDLKDEYAGEVQRLLQISQEAAVPVVGFVDHSYARELVKMVDALDGRASETRRYPYNAQILRTPLPEGVSLLPAWGDRTILFHFIPDRTHPADSVEVEGALGFCYLQTTADSLPARLDVPQWVYDTGLFEEVIDTVRAECVVGLGYPYAIETADEAAVMTSRDREIFLRAIQEFAEAHNLPFRVSRKPSSKTRRR
jgi:hypothetical protein